jgi:hypothetical protein
MSRSRGISVFAALLAVVVIAAPTVLARGDDNDRRLSAEPWIFVGTAAQCGGPAGSRIVTSAWLGGMGLPDNGGPNAPATSTARDPHRGLLLNKNGPTTDCSSSGATIHGVKGMTIANPALFMLGYDYRFGGHCGAGAPRFNITVRTASGDEFTYFIGCAATTTGPSSQDSQWLQTRSAAAAAFPQTATQPAVIPAGSRIVALDIVFDEGTDTSSVSDPNGVGLAVLDNIYVNGQYIRSGSGIEPGGGGRENDDHGGHGDNDDNDD